MAQDCMMRLVQQAAQMIAALLGHREAGQTPEAIRELESNSLQIAGLPLEFVRKCPPEALWQLLSQGGGLRYGRAVMLAELLLQDSEICLETHRPVDSLQSKLQALHLLAESITTLSRDDAAYYGPKLEDLARELDPAGESERVRQQIQAYRTQWGL